MRKGVVVLFLVTFAFAQGSPKGFIEMPPAKDGSYLLAGKPGDNRRWGRPETIRALILVAKEWNRRYKGKYKLVIGDISKKDGSHFPPHKTHRDGLRVDITTRPNVCDIRFPNQKITLELARLFVRFGAWRIFYNHPYVTSRLKEVRKLEKHDSHFHVEFDPRRVPKGEGPFVVAAPPVTEESFVGREHLRRKKGKTFLPVQWTLLGASSHWQYKCQVFLYHGDKVIYATEPMKTRKNYYWIPCSLEHGEKYAWKVVVWNKQGKQITTGRVPFQTDFTPPKVEVVFPKEGEKTDTCPTFRWVYKDEESRQFGFQIQLDTNRNHKRVAWQSERIFQDTQEFPLPFVLKKRAYYWRVIVWDGRGNSATSPWQKFYVTKKKKWKTYFVRVKSKRLNLRKGPSTSYPILARLRKGQRLLVLRELGKWLYVRVRVGKSVITGFVHRDYVER